MNKQEMIRKINGHIQWNLIGDDEYTKGKRWALEQVLEYTKELDEPETLSQEWNNDPIQLSTDSTQEEIEKWLDQTKKKRERINTLIKQEQEELENEIQEAKKILNLIYGVNVDAPFYK